MKLLKRVKNGIFMVLTAFILIFSTIFSSTVNTYADPTPDNPSEVVVETPSSTPVETPEAPVETPIETPVETPETPVETTVETPDTTPETPSDSPETTETENKTTKKKKKDDDPDQAAEEADATCQDQVGAIAWLICPTSGVIAKAVDGIYSVIKDIIVVSPITNDNDNPIFIVWQYARDITNIVFVIMILVVIYSQLTGVGFDNYNIKKTLPRIIIAAILVNFSFLICSALVDFSNIIGTSFRSFFESIENNAINAGAFGDAPNVTWSQLAGVLGGGVAVAGFSISLAGGLVNFLWMLIPVLVSALLAVVTGLITISLRQAVIYLLIMIAPLAFVCYLLPNTEKWFKKWKDILFSMLIFFPMFSLLFGASHLAGWAIIASANSAFGLILGMGVQVIPLFLSVSLMKMSGSILGSINSKLNGLAGNINSRVKPWATDHAEAAKSRQRAEALKRGFNPFLGSSYAAWMATNKAKRDDARRRNDELAKTLTEESVIAQRSGRRIIGRRENGAPIYATHVVQRKDKDGKIYTSREEIVRSNRAMEEEYAAREAKLRLEGRQMELDNAMNSIDAYMKEYDFTSDRLKNLSRQQGQNYLAYRTQMSAKARNARADERFYNEQIRKASELDKRTGRIKNQALYDKLIKAGAGSDAYNDDANIRQNALTTVTADSYEAYEKAMKETTDKYTTYLDKQVTKNVLTSYKSSLITQSTEAVVAAQNVLARRGDYDKIEDYIANYLDHTKSKVNTEADFSNLKDDQYMKLGSDFANALALNVLGMKDAAPILARLGKSINMETWRSSNGQRATDVFKYRDFYFGDKNGGNNQARTSLPILMEGTDLTKMDRTGAEAWFQAIERYAGGDEDEFIAQMSSKIPQFISAFPTYQTDGETMMSSLKLFTGLKYNSSNRKWEPQQNVPIREELIKQYIGGLTDKDFVSFKTNVFQAMCEAVAKNHNMTCYTPNPITGEEMFAPPKAVTDILKSYANENTLKVIQNNLNHGNNAGMKQSIINAFGLKVPGSNNNP